VVSCILETLVGVLEALGGILEVLGNVLEAFAIVLEAILDQNRPEPTQESEHLAKETWTIRFFDFPPGAS